jgi:hypothetical protein
MTVQQDQQQTDAQLALLRNVIDELRRDKEELRRGLEDLRHALHTSLSILGYSKAWHEDAGQALRFCLRDLVKMKDVSARTRTASLLKLHNSSLIRPQLISTFIDCSPAPAYPAGPSGAAPRRARWR